MTKTTVRESAAIGAPASRSGNMLIQLITPGVGSSGVYSAAVLEAAARDAVFPAGMLMFADHPGEAEAYDRPERSIRDVAGVLVEDARWDAEGQALVAEARTYSPWKEVISEMADAIGVSIRASARMGGTDPETGRPIVESLGQGVSVDFVTYAGRGGAIREVYESSRSTARLLVRETGEAAPAPAVEEASNRARNEELRSLVKAANPTGEYTYLEDFDDDTYTVVFSIDRNDSGEEYYQQGYTVTNGVASSLVGNPTRVDRRVVYVPATEASVSATPAGQSEICESRKEDTMPNIEEGRLAALEEADRRVPVLESERDVAIKRAEEAEAAEDKAIAESIIAGADHKFTALETRGLLASLPLKEGRLDRDAFSKTVTEEAAAAAEAAGAGTPKGIGESPQPEGDTSELSESELNAALAAISGRTVKEA